VLGYASFGDWRPFDGFRHTVEHSVYVRSDQRGNGLGPVDGVLIERAKGLRQARDGRRHRKRQPASIRLHERRVRTTGQMPQVGTKFGRWLDLTFMQLTLNPGAQPSANKE
jgi:phosphinothricin acetyltransferase